MYGTMTQQDGVVGDDGRGEFNALLLMLGANEKRGWKGSGVYWVHWTNAQRDSLVAKASYAVSREDYFCDGFYQNHNSQVYRLFLS